MKLQRQLLKTGIPWLVLLAFMGFSQPTKLPVLLLIVPFLLLFWAFLQTWVLVQQLYARVSGRDIAVSRRRIGASISAVLVLLLILQSLGQLTLRDVATVVAIGLLGYVYVVRGHLQSKRP